MNYIALYIISLERLFTFFKFQIVLTSKLRDWYLESMHVNTESHIAGDAEVTEEASVVPAEPGVHVEGR